MNKIADYTNLLHLIELINARSVLQRKKIEKFIAKRDVQELTVIEDLLRKYVHYLDLEKIPLESAVQAYLAMCSGMIKCQIYFLKTGKYPIESSTDAFRDVYDNVSQMKPYMLALALSQFLWESHFQIYKAFNASVKKYSGSIRRYLEIGPGHGLYLHAAIDILAGKAKYTAVDISEASIGISKRIVESLVEHLVDVRYITTDMLTLNSSEQFDFITMGEVIEHVNEPDRLLRKMRSLMAPSARGFISTCVNCPAIDHVYQFHEVGEVRRMLENNGLSIEDEHVLPVEDLPMEEIIEKKVTINYCATVKHRNVNGQI